MTGDEREESMMKDIGIIKLPSYKVQLLGSVNIE